MAGSVRFGVIGCGVMGPRHLQSIANVDGAQAVAVADLIPERARAAADRFAVERLYGEGRELIEDPDVDAVILALPATHRTELALAAFEAGKHVLTEKPVACSADEVRQMIAARGRLTAGCCSNRFRHFDHARTLRTFLADEPLGPLRLLRARHLQPCGKKPDRPRPEWRLRKDLNGGGILFNWGCYDLDYLLGLVGWQLVPRTVLARAWTVPPQFESHVAPGSDAETYYAALVLCEGGAVLSLERGEYMPAAADEAWQIVGERGSVRMRMVPGENKQIVHDDTLTDEGVMSRVIWQGDESFGGSYADRVLEDFADAVREGRQPDTSLERSLVVQQITDAIIASAESGEAVEIR